MIPLKFIKKKNSAFLWAIEPDVDNIKRLIGLVQNNQDFFGNPPASQSCIKLVADKLEELIEASKTGELPAGTIATCKMCGQSIRYVNPYWEHLTGELQPRHPAWPK